MTTEEIDAPFCDAHRPMTLRCFGCPECLERETVSLRARVARLEGALDDAEDAFGQIYADANDERCSRVGLVGMALDGAMSVRRALNRGGTENG